jgi:hypothetical protein
MFTASELHQTIRAFGLNARGVYAAVFDESAAIRNEVRESLPLFESLHRQRLDELL